MKFFSVKNVFPMATSKREIQYFQTKRSESVKYLKIFYFDSKPRKHTTKLFHQNIFRKQKQNIIQILFEI